jgi:acyl transferase domain-containing protein/NAD(P)-dependent dehydrogenase (short-subunit alcohol dehydrogenase family)/acyl carrier protein
MENTSHRAIAIVGVGAVLPDAPDAKAFWENVKGGRYSISETRPDRWDPALYYDADPTAPDKTYSKIGGWVREFDWEPVKWHLAIPPRVVAAMDDQQRWAIACTREALEDFGYPQRSLNLDRTAVILGNAMAGEKHYFTALRVYFPEYVRELSESASFTALPVEIRREITRELHQRIGKLLPEITEDSMPGELANCIAGRVANLYNFHGPNFTTDAACASAMAAISAAMEGLIEHDFDTAITGGVDHNMGASSFIKFCKIGALSATGTRPYAEGADGFVMGEGAAIFLMKRLADAERDGDRIYAVLRGIGGSSDGKGKGITAPNPVGQRLCLERAWQNAGLSPATVTLIEGHGTSTKVGDVVEVQSMTDVLSSFHLPTGSVALGSVKSNIGHLKGAAGAAGVLKATLALRDKVLPPSLHFEHPNPDIDFGHSPLRVNTELRPWSATADGVRRAGVSAFGFGGTNFHVVLEEYIPHRLNGNGKLAITVPEPAAATSGSGLHAGGVGSPLKTPLRGALVIGAASEPALVARLREVEKAAGKGEAPAPAAPAESDLRAPERLAIDYGDAAELAEKSAKALKALAADQPAIWRALRAQGVFRGKGPAPKVAFLYTGQGSQYVNMLKELRAAEPIVAEAFAEADRVMTPLLGKPLSEFIFVDRGNGEAVARAEDDLRQTAITQPAVLTTDLALTRLLGAYGVQPDLTMGHSLGEYGALVASGALPFDDALEAVSARGREMTRVSMDDNGKMAAIFAPLEEIERILKTVNGYVVIANINSNSQAVIGGASKPVDEAVEVFQKGGYTAVPLPVSHAFHTSIVAPASEPLRRMLGRLRVAAPRIPIVANVSGEFYPVGPGVVPEMLDILSRQVASPVQFVRGLHTLYAAGARVFVEVGPKKALQGFADNVFGDRDDVVALFTNHPKTGDVVSFNQALCGLYAAGLGRGTPAVADEVVPVEAASATPPASLSAAMTGASSHTAEPARVSPVSEAPLEAPNGDRYAALGHFFANVLEKGWEIYGGARPASARPVTITGAALGLPGTEHIFDDANVSRILRGDQFIDVIPTKLRRAMLDKHITRLVKSENGGATFESITSLADVIKLAARGGILNLESEFGVSAERIAALDRVTRLAIAAGIDALRDAGIPLVMRYKTTSKGTQLPDRWGLPESLRDETGVIFASAFPGYNAFAQELTRHHADQGRHERLTMLESLRSRAVEDDVHSSLLQELDRRIGELREEIGREGYTFDRRFLFRILSMGHSQFAEFIGARGPNTQINAACASTAQAMGLAEDWINAGRCRRVIVVSADDVTSDEMMEWIGAGFLASGAAATDEVVEDAAIPFDRRRHGMIVGMGAAALVIESSQAVRERGMRPICEVLATVTANSAFHGTRLDVEHISHVMEGLIRQAETRNGIRRQEIAPHTVFVSHETYTPARGGSASAEITALRNAFGPAADQIVIANTKGFTGHAMATGIEEVVAVKALETGCVPPVANFKEIDPDLGRLNLSKGGIYPVEYALRLGAGFGSQVCMTLLRRVAGKDNVRPGANALGYRYRIEDAHAWNAWLGRVAGHPVEDLQVVHRTLRVPDTTVSARTAPAARAPQSSTSPAGPADQTATAVSAVSKIAAPAAAAAEPSGPAAAPMATPAAPPKAKPAVAADPVKERILALVAEKTGYPTDMLDLDLDLEADLGVDTVKQAEVFASVREAYGIARDDSIKLREFPTLAHVIRFVYDRRPDLVSQPPDSAPSEPAAETLKVKATVAAPAKNPSTDRVKERILDLAVEKTGYPRDMLDLDLDLEADLGVDTVKQAEMFAAIREIYNIPRDENRKLRDYPTLAHVIRFVYERRPDLSPAVPRAPVTGPVETAPTSTAPASAPGAATDDPVTAKVLEIVAEKTGYPLEMLDFDLDLEADLGIDTVKQAEMFASVRAAYNIPRDETLKLRDFPTLAHVIQFARDRQPGAASASSPVLDAAQRGSGTEASRQAAVSSISSFVPVSARPAPGSLEAANSIPRRVPVPTLRPPLDLCKPTAVKLGPGTRVIVMPDCSGVAAELTRQLQGLGVEVLLIDDGPQADVLGNSLMNWLAEGEIHGVYWLPALDHEGSLREMDLAAWHNALTVRVKLLYVAMRDLYHHISKAGTFLVSATRLGGQHGYDAAGAAAPLGGAVTGFTKAYKRERMDALVKAVDFGTENEAKEIARALIDETLRDPGAVEIGYKDGLRWTVGLEEQPASDGRGGMTLDFNTVFVVTGAAGSIVSAITADLAAASGGTFHLLDLVPEPDPGHPDLKRLVSDKGGLKRDLFARIQARGERATPALVEKELAALEREQAACVAIEAVRAAGGTAHYYSVNLADAEAAAKVIDQIRERSGRIDVLLHGAGIERSHFLPDKDPREFDLVFDVKSDGWFNLLHPIGEMPLGATVAFSSIAARFGNGGQTDYSAANDLLCKITSSFRNTRPSTRGIVIDWTAWGGIGMATRGSIPKMMELAGIDMLPPEAGIPLIRRELTAGGTRGEVVVAQRLGALLNEWDSTGGLDPGAVQAMMMERAAAPGPMTGAVTTMSLEQGLRMETTLDPSLQPFLYDHQIDRTPVLPGVMGIEAFAEAAQWLLPGWHIESVDNVDFLAPFKFYRNERRTVTVEALFRSQGDGIVAACRLLGQRSLPNQAEPQVTAHFTASVRLTKRPYEAATRVAPGAPVEPVVEAPDIYRAYFHGPAYQVLERAWREGTRIIGQMAANLPDNHRPSQLPTLMAPRLIELCFQAAGIGEMSEQGRMGLPRHLDRVSLWRPPQQSQGPLYAVVTPDPRDGSFDAEVLDASGNCYVSLSGYHTVALPGSADSEALKALQAILSPQAVMA